VKNLWGFVQLNLKQAGIDSKQGTWVDLECPECGTEFKTGRSRARKSSGNYCSDTCYYKSRATTNCKESRQGQRIGRQVGSQYFEMPPKSVVHHEDGDDHNNDLSNLRVFASQSDHLKYHHGVNAVTPIWDGRTASESRVDHIAA